jgi:hypothetical protein
MANEQVEDLDLRRSVRNDPPRQLVQVCLGSRVDGRALSCMQASNARHVDNASKLPLNATIFLGGEQTSVFIWRRREEPRLTRTALYRRRQKMVGKERRESNVRGQRTRDLVLSQPAKRNSAVLMCGVVDEECDRTQYVDEVMGEQVRERGGVRGILNCNSNVDVGMAAS